MKEKERIAPSAPGSSWTRPDDYIGAMARKRSFRRAREGEPRNLRITSRNGFATVPLAAILAVLAVLAVAIMAIAFPGSQPAPKARPNAAHEQGVAQRGWFQDAQKEMHR